jgi:hypothetical protein
MYSNNSHSSRKRNYHGPWLWLSWSFVIVAYVWSTGTVQAQIVSQPTWFDSWVFGNQSEAEFKKTLFSNAVLDLRRMEKYAPLTDAQKQKLLLAAQGDIARFMRSVEKAKTATAGMQPDQEHIQKIQEFISPLQTKIQRGILGEESLFRRELNQVLDATQLAAVEEGINQRQKQMLVVSIRLELSKLELRMPMIESQRNALIGLIEAELAEKKIPTRYHSYAINCLLGLLPEEKLQSVLDAEQIKVIKSNDANRDNMRNFLAQQGIKFP